jgi:cell division protein FtsX
MNLRLAIRLGWGTLRSRLALSVLAVILLSVGAAGIAGVSGTVYLLHDLERNFLSALSVELELTDDAEATRSGVMSRAEKWPSAEFVQFISPDQTMREIQRETGEDLRSLFGSNPFPALVRVRFGHTTLPVVDSLTASAKSWPGVAQVVYPRRLWSDVDRFIERFRGNLGIAAGGFVLVILVLVGLCIHAQVRNRAATWEFLTLSGASTGTLRLSVFVQGAFIGLVAGLIACGILYALMAAYSWLFIRPVNLPLLFYAAGWLASVILGIIAGVFSARRI